MNARIRQRYGEGQHSMMDAFANADTVCRATYKRSVKFKHTNYILLWYLVVVVVIPFNSLIISVAQYALFFLRFAYNDVFFSAQTSFEKK